LNFPSVNGHDIEQSNANRLQPITDAGNSLGMYYNSYNDLFTTTPNAADAVNTIHNSFTTARFGSTAPSRWLVLNEIDAGTWSGSNGATYRTWLVDTLKGLHDIGYEKIILWTPRYLASKTYASTFKEITKYAYLGLETYLDGYTIKNSYNYSLSSVQAYYQGYYNSWTSTTNGPGVAPSRLFAGEHFGVYPHNYVAGQYYGSNGVSGADWQAAIQARSIAIHNIPFGGFIGYLWQRNQLATNNDATDLANQLSYERAYAATMVVQTEVPTWTGNAGTTNTWGDGFNWTGGLPSTTQHPFPLLAATNPNLLRQTTANFFDTIKSNTTVTLDGNRTVTRLAFDSPYAYTIARGTGGLLTLSGTGASLSVQEGSHAISANVVFDSNVAASISGELTISGSFINNGRTLSKTGAGTLRLLGGQINTTPSLTVVNAGVLETISIAPDTSLTIAGGKVKVLPSAPTLPSHPAGSIAFISRPRQLTISATSTLDLANNDLILAYGAGTPYNGVSPIASLEAMVARGFNGGNWLGTGITSSTAASDDAAGTFVLAIADNATLAAPYGVFDGVSITEDTVLIKFTHRVDLNLDGLVTDADAIVFSTNFEAGASATWSIGDLDYDGVFSDNDVIIFGTFYDTGLAHLPEPAAMGALGMLSFGLVRRRRRAEQQERTADQENWNSWR
jgi:hypothetical protein